MAVKSANRTNVVSSKLSDTSDTRSDSGIESLDDEGGNDFSSSGGTLSLFTLGL